MARPRILRKGGYKKRRGPLSLSRKRHIQAARKTKRGRPLLRKQVRNKQLRKARISALPAKNYFALYKKGKYLVGVVLKYQKGKYQVFTVRGFQGAKKLFISTRKTSTFRTALSRYLSLQDYYRTQGYKKASASLAEKIAPKIGMGQVKFADQTKKRGRKAKKSSKRKSSRKMAAGRRLVGKRKGKKGKRKGSKKRRVGFVGKRKARKAPRKSSKKRSRRRR